MRPVRESTRRERIAARLIETGHCGLVDGADVVVSTCSMQRGDRLLAVLGSKGSTPVVFEAPAPDFERYAHLAENATLLPEPVTEQALLDAVAEARARATPGEPPR